MRGVAALGVVALVMLCLLTLPRGAPEVECQSISYTPHGQILIYNDDDFTAENGVVGGNGTYGDPYVISGWDIDISDIEPDGNTPSGGIQIGNTLSDVLIRDLRIRGDFEPVEIDGSTRFMGNPAMTMYFGSNVRIENCVLSGTTGGIQLRGMSNVVIRGNTITDNGYGIYVDECSQVYLVDNSVSYSHFGNVLLHWIDNSIVVNNTITHSLEWVGMDLYGSENCQVMNNTIADNPDIGLNVGFCRHCDILGNVITNNSMGIYIYDPEDVTLAENIFAENEKNIDGLSEGNSYFWPAVAAAVVAVAAIAVATYLFLKRDKKISQ